MGGSLLSSSNDEGLASLDALIARVRKLGKMPEDVARVGAPLVLEAAKKTARAGTTPEGKPWPLTKKGDRALVNAADHLSVKASGPTITLTLKGKAEVVHNYGDSKAPKRQILPDGGAGVPKGIADAVRKAAIQVFEGAT